MKQTISGPAGIAIAVVVIGILCFFLYTKFMKSPGAITPESMRENMMKGQKQQQELGQQRGGPPGMAPSGGR